MKLCNQKWCDVVESTKSNELFIASHVFRKFVIEGSGWFVVMGNERLFDSVLLFLKTPNIKVIHFRSKIYSFSKKAILHRPQSHFEAKSLYLHNLNDVDVGLVSVSSGW